MINGAGDPVLQNTATLENQQQANVKASGQSPTPLNATGDSATPTQPSTIVTLGTKQDEAITYSALGGIRQPPLEAKKSTLIETQTTLEASATDDTTTNVTGGIRKPPP